MFDADAFELCGRHGLHACVELKTLRADFGQCPELTPIGVDGQPIRYGRLVQGVCLSQQVFLDETAAALEDGVRQYAPAGIWLDYLSGAGWFETPNPDLQDSCFCSACVDAFCEGTDIDASAPRAIIDHHLEAWTRHNCERVAAYGQHLADVIRQHRPDCVIGAYMCPWQPHEYDGALTRIFAQDYELLAGFVDVFTPLIYANKSGRGPEWGGEWLEAAHAFVPADRHVQLILDVLDFPASLEAVAEADTSGWGVQVFGGGDVFADPEHAACFREAVDRMRSRAV